jgi:hypothetical protein
MTQYLLSVYQPDGEPPGPEVLDPIVAKLQKLQAEMRSAGAWVFAGGLCEPSTATVLRGTYDDGILMTDGPYTEGKEHLGGFTVIEAPDLDAAIEWGRKAADATTLPVEVRPFQENHV